MAVVSRPTGTHFPAGLARRPPVASEGAERGLVHRRFWFPFVRLGLVFMMTVVAGNVVLAFTFTRSEVRPVPERKLDFSGKRIKRVEKHWRRVRRFLFGRDSGDAGSVPPRASGAAWMEDPVLEAAREGPPASDDRIGTASASSRLDVPRFAASETSPGASAFAGPAVPEDPWRPVLHLSCSEVSPPSGAESGFGSPGPVGLWGVGDALLRGPEALLDCVLREAVEVFPRPRDSADHPGGGIFRGLLDVDVSPRRGSLFWQFGATLVERERRYFGRFGESELDGPGFEDRTEDVRARGLLREQEKVLWEALLRAYFSKYDLRGEDRIRNDAFSVTRWDGVDFVVLPPLVSGYLYFRGLEKRFSMGETWIGLSVEPISRWGAPRREPREMVSLQGGIREVPVGLIVSAGRRESRAALEFVGIGTTFGAVRKALLSDAEVQRAVRSAGAP